MNIFTASTPSVPSPPMVKQTSSDTYVVTWDEPLLTGGIPIEEYNLIAW